MTGYARQILNLINASDTHMTAEGIFFELKKTQPKIVLATVYNNLNMLCRENLIRRIGVEGEADRFDKIKRHDHLVCKSCGRIADFDFGDLTADFEKQAGGKLLGYDLKVFYICDECKKKN